MRITRPETELFPEFEINETKKIWVERRHHYSFQHTRLEYFI